MFSREAGGPPAVSYGRALPDSVTVHSELWAL